ncbi:hypothetical protein T09_502 [Trichinella sp. T9]|nr:hypothetical protein T09_502 [Trichinella sp. T9]
MTMEEQLEKTSELKNPFFRIFISCKYFFQNVINGRKWSNMYHCEWGKENRYPILPSILPFEPTKEDFEKPTTNDGFVDSIRFDF